MFLGAIKICEVNRVPAAVFSSLSNSGTQHIASHHGGYFKEDCGLSFVGKGKGEVL